MITTRHPYERVRRSGTTVVATPWERVALADDPSRITRVCRYLDARRWIVAVSNIVAAVLFVVGCVCFYFPALYAGSVTVFLCGSVLFLAGALCSALLEHGPSS